MTVTFGNALPESGVRETRWLTPPHIVEALGTFDLDPCGAPGHHLAGTTYQIDDGQDGLSLPWFGRVWLNPPYGREGEPFMQRMVDHGRGTALLFARTETRAFFETIWDNATALLFLRGRLRFLKSDFSGGGAQTHHQSSSLTAAKMPRHFTKANCPENSFDSGRRDK